MGMALDLAYSSRTREGPAPELGRTVRGRGNSSLRSPPRAAAAGTPAGHCIAATALAFFLRVIFARILGCGARQVGDVECRVGEAAVERVVLELLRAPPLEDDVDLLLRRRIRARQPKRHVERL